MFKKSLAIILSISLCLGLMIQGSFAFTYPSGIYDFDVVFLAGESSIPSVRQDFYDSCTSHLIDSNSNVVIFSLSYTVSGTNLAASEIYYVVCEDGKISTMNNRFYCTSPSVTCASGYFNYNSYGGGEFVVTSSSSVAFTAGGEDYYLIPYLEVSYNLKTYGSLYSSNSIYVDSTSNLYTPANLDISSFTAPPRLLLVSADDINGSHMICFTTDDTPSSDSFISFDYTDSLGSWHTFLDISDCIVSWGEGVNYIFVDPLKISLYQFTLTGGTYYGSDSWGYFDYSCDLDFNVNPLELNSNFYDSYYYYNTTYTNYDNVRTSGFVYMYGNPTGTESYFWDEYEFLIQPFKFSIIALPIVVDKNTLPGANIIDIFVNSYSDSYDILLLDVPETYFNYLYGAGAYADLRSDLDEYPTAIGLAGYINDWYSSNSLVPSQFPYSLKDSGITHTISQSCGIIYTDSFFYKQLSYLIGDNSDILSEFSERFFKPNGFSDYLMSNLSDIYNQDYDYYSDSLSYLTKINYYLNDAFEKQYLPSIVSSLTSSNSYLLSIDSKLSDVDDILAALSDLSYLSDISTSVGYLDDILTDTNSVVTGFGLLLSDTGDILDLLGDIEDESSAGVNYLSAIDGDLGDLLEWFQNQEDSDVVLMLPDFDPDVLIEIYGSGIGDFVDWFNTWVAALPDFDYSEFPDFFDNISDLIDEFADSNDDLIGNLDTPYEYNDSKLHYLGWD